MGMHVPWIQVTQEAWDLANQFAGLTGLTFQEAFTGLIEAWRWGVALGPETEPPQGVCDSPRALDRLASVMRLLRMDRQMLAEALEELEVIELRPVGLRVRGTRRYWPAWAKNNPDAWKAWKAARPDEFPGSESKPPGSETEPDRSRNEPEPKPDENRPVSAPQTHTHTHTHEKQKPPAPARAGEADKTRPSGAQFRPPAPQGDDPEFIAFFAQAQDDRSAAFPESIPEPPPRKSWDQWADFKAKVPDPRRRRDTWLAYLEDTHARTTKPPCCWALFASQPHKYVPGQSAQAPPRDDRPPCSACDQRKETAVFNGRRLCYRCAAETQRATA